ncbi:MAG: Rrf2 family transcriptional regulator [Euryarchaeota archaeon]|nr:Rrf2 family transcriptional regulator [Euryarchaeota archaeon]
MRLTRESEYALKALLHLVRAPGAVPMARLAREEGLPPAYLSKVLQNLSRAGLVTASRGPERGYRLARPPGSIRLREVLEAVEGADLFKRCLFWGHRCGGQDPCMLHSFYAPVRDEMVRVAEKVVLSSLEPEPRRSRPL